MLLPRVRRLSLLLATSAAFLPAYYTYAATTEISDAETKPVSTGGKDITIDSGGSITVGSKAGAAVTVNSVNSVDNEGSINGNDGNNQSGILVTVGGKGQSILNDGAITITDSTLATTLPLTQGQNRYGIQINTAPGAALFTGNITNSSTGAITVRGNHSAGIYINTGGLKGGIINSGSIGITGNNSFGILVNPDAPLRGGGGIAVNNVIDSLGQGSGGILLNGRVTGQLYINSTIRSDGYFSGAVITDRSALTGLTAKNEYQASSAVTVNKSVGKGILVSTGGTLVTYGSAAALSITPGAGSTATIGPTSIDKTTKINGPDVLISGEVSGNGIFDGVNATAVRIGGGGGIAKLADGLTINAGAKVDATAYTGKDLVTGNIGGNATAISLGAGAEVSAINNAGEISATVNFGADGTTPGRAAAIVVDGGALGAINNTGQIIATTPKGQAVAMDLRGDTVFATVTQASSGTTTPASITGNILFGAKGGDLELNSGTIDGNVHFGKSDDNVLSIHNGSVLGGNITQAAGGQLELNVVNGRLTSTNTGTTAVSQLTIGKKGEIDFAIDPTTLKNGNLSVSGNIIFAQGAKIGLTLDTQLLTPETFTVIDGTSTSGLGSQADLVLGNVPYFYNAKIITNPGNGTVSVGLSDRPFSQAGVLGSESAYNAVFKDSYVDPGIRDAFNAGGSQQQFKRLFAQMLPSYSGGLFEVLSQGADTLARTQADSSVAMRGDRSGGWAQQFGFGAVDSTSSAPGYHGGGLGFAFGWENPITVTSAWGFSAAYMRAAVDDFNTGPGNEQVGTTYTVGAYYREADGRLHYDATLNAGVAEMNGSRYFSGVDLTGKEIDRAASASWLGGLLQAHVGVSYEEQLSEEFYVRPQLSGDYFLLSQGSYNEHNGGKAFDLAVNGQTDSQGSVTGGIAVGMQFGDRDFMWKPEVMVGYRQVFGGPDSVTAAFAGGSAFTLSPASQKGGVIARIGIHGGNKFSDIAIEAGGEDRDNYRSFDGRIVARFNFSTPLSV